MIIFGTRGVTSTAARGRFHCPQCATKSRYRQQRVRRFFTLYFIPLIPLDRLGEYVECSSCRGTWDSQVLNYDPEKETARFEAKFERAVKRTMVLMLLADGVIDDDEIAEIREVYGSVANGSISEQDVRQEIESAQRDGRGVADYLGELGSQLNEHGKELVVRAAYAVAAADGQFLAEEVALLKEIRAALEMAPAHFRGLIAELNEDRRS